MPGEGGRLTVGLRSSWGSSPLQEKCGLHERSGESPGKGAETTQLRSKDDPFDGDVLGDLVKRRHHTGASPNSRNDSSGLAGRALSWMLPETERGLLPSPGTIIIYRNNELSPFFVKSAEGVLQTTWFILKSFCNAWYHQTYWLERTKLRPYYPFISAANPNKFALLTEFYGYSVHYLGNYYQCTNEQA